MVVCDDEAGVLGFGGDHLRRTADMLPVAAAPGRNFMLETAEEEAIVQQKTDPLPGGVPIDFAKMKDPVDKVEPGQQTASGENVIVEVVQFLRAEVIGFSFEKGDRNLSVSPVERKGQRDFPPDDLLLEVLGVRRNGDPGIGVPPQELHHRNQVTLGLSRAGSRLDGEDGVVVQRGGDMARVGDLRGSERITFCFRRKTTIEIPDPGDRDLLSFLFLVPKRDGRWHFFQKPFPFRHLLSHRRIKEAAEIVTEVPVEMEKDVAEEGGALTQVKTEGRRGGEFRRIQDMAADVTNEVEGECYRLRRGEGKFLPGFPVEVFPQRFQCGAVRLGEEEFGGEAEIDHARVAAPGKQRFDLIAGIECYNEIGLPEKGGEEGRDIRERRGCPQRLPGNARGMPVPLRRLPVTDSRCECLLRPVRGDHRRGDLVDPVAILLRKPTVGEKAGDLPDRPMVRLQHRFLSLSISYERERIIILPMPIWQRFLHRIGRIGVFGALRLPPNAPYMMHNHRITPPCPAVQRRMKNVEKCRVC